MFEEEKRKKKKKKKHKKKERRRDSSLTAKPKEWTERGIEIREMILKLPGNTECAECSCKYPDWSSINLGVMICTECAGIHRGLGTHISKVRSIEMDVWPEQQLINFFRLGGNTKVNLHWEASLKKSAKPTESDRRMLTEFIRQKYMAKSFLAKENKDVSSDEGSETSSDDEEQRYRQEEARRKKKKKEKKKKKKKKKKSQKSDSDSETEEEVTVTKKLSGEAKQVEQIGRSVDILDLNDNQGSSEGSKNAVDLQTKKEDSTGETDEDAMFAKFFGERVEDTSAIDEMDALFT